VSAAAAAIVQPSTNPVVVAVAPARAPAPITIEASGFAPRALVYVEQCDGVAPGAPQWSPTVHCDLGSSPSPAIADDDGHATFSSSDPNHAFRPFVGESPQSLFNCLAPAQRPPANGLATSAKCNIRVSTSNTSVTSDQTFVDMSFRTSTTSATRGAGGTAVGKARARSSEAPTPAIGAGRRPAMGGSSVAGSTAASSPIAFVVAPRHANSGLLSLSDASLVTGYIFIIGGCLMAAVSIAGRRRPLRVVGSGDRPTDPV
jgi:hypothetical protein